MSSSRRTPAGWGRGSHGLAGGQNHLHCTADARRYVGTASFSSPVIAIRAQSFSTDSPGTRCVCEICFARLVARFEIGPTR